MLLGVSEQSAAVRMDIFVAVRVVKHQKGAAAAQRHLLAVDFGKLRRVNIGIELRILIAVFGDGIAGDRRADRVGAVKPQRLSVRKLFS